MQGDNGWTCFGEPIKTVQYRDEVRVAIYFEHRVSQSSVEVINYNRRGIDYKTWDMCLGV